MTSRRVLIPLELTPQVRMFLLSALVAEARRCRVDGLRPPEEVRSLIDWLTGVQEGSKFDASQAVPDPELEVGSSWRRRRARSTRVAMSRCQASAK